MPNPLNVYSKLSGGSYQYMDGSNYTFAGLEGGIKKGGKSIGALAAIGSDFETRTDLMIDIKGSSDYDKKGIFNQNIRLRTKLGKDNSTFQVRYSPITVNVPVGKDLEFYTNLHYSGQYNGEKWKNSMGAFCGVSKSFKNTTMSVEVQRYNLQNLSDNSSGNYGVNFLISRSF